MPDPRPRQISRYEIGTGKPWRRNIPTKRYNTLNVSCTATFVGVPSLDELMALHKTDLHLRADTDNLPALATHTSPTHMSIDKGEHHYELVRIGTKTPTLICYCRECQSGRQAYLLHSTNAKRKAKGKRLIGGARYYQR